MPVWLYVRSLNSFAYKPGEGLEVCETDKGGEKWKCLDCVAKGLTWHTP